MDVILVVSVRAKVVRKVPVNNDVTVGSMVVPSTVESNEKGLVSSEICETPVAGTVT